MQPALEYATLTSQAEGKLLEEAAAEGKRYENI
jgi:hypothetical protein